MNRPLEPKVSEDGKTIQLFGVGPTCPNCHGPTHAVTGDEKAERPWWCSDCNLRLNDIGEYGSHAYLPA